MSWHQQLSPITNKPILFLVLHILLLTPKYINSQKTHPPGLNLTQWNNVLGSEVPNDIGTNSTLFDANLDFEWDRSESSTTQSYPFVICNRDEEKSGSERINYTRTEITVTGKPTWVSTFYNKDEITCFGTWMNGNDLITVYDQLSQADKDDFRVMSVSQSMKMAPKTVEEIERQLTSQTLIRWSVQLSPGVVEGGSFTPTSAGEDILQSIQSSPGEVSNSSFFYQLGSAVTEQIEFWQESLDNGFNTGDGCQSILDIVHIIDYETLSIIGYEVQFSTALANSREQACIWSILQGIALHPNSFRIDPLFKSMPRGPSATPVPSTAASDFSFSCIGLSLVGSTLLLVLVAL